jgi:putative glutamine amidotransferase
MTRESSNADSPLIVVAVGDPELAENPSFAALKNELYAEGIRRHGGTPALIHSATPAKDRDSLLQAMSGLLLSGGADLEPSLYGQTPNGAAGMDLERDELELSAWREAERRAVPVLGICRGLQAINVFLGGSLLQDVPSHAGIPYGRGQAHVHPIEIDRESILGRTLGAGAGSDQFSITVNTFHHQAVRDDTLASGLRSSAWAGSEFGRLVEGFEGTGDRWLMAVQCHPERIDSTPADFERLWASFVAAARELAAKPVAGSARRRD